jgi:hypothetical protein
MIAAAKTEPDPELDNVRAFRDVWARLWDPELPLRKLLHRMQDPDYVELTSSEREVAAEPMRVELDLPTRCEKHSKPLAELQGMDVAAQMIERVKADLVAECRRRGRSWAQIGEALGVSRQSAWMKYAAPEDE